MLLFFFKVSVSYFIKIVLQFFMENGIPYDPEYVFHDVRVSFFRNLKVHVLEVSLLRKKIICMIIAACIFIIFLFDFINFIVLKVVHFSVLSGNSAKF